MDALSSEACESEAMTNKRESDAAWAARRVAELIAKLRQMLAAGKVIPGVRR